MATLPNSKQPKLDVPVSAEIDADKDIEHVTDDLQPVAYIDYIVNPSTILSETSVMVNTHLILNADGSLSYSSNGSNEYHQPPLLTGTTSSICGVCRKVRGSSGKNGFPFLKLSLIIFNKSFNAIRFIA